MNYVCEMSVFDKKLQKSWDACREGMRLVRESEENRQRVVEWACAERFGHHPYTMFWIKLIELDLKSDYTPLTLEELLQTKRWASLPRNRREYWRPFITSAPFVAIRDVMGLPENGSLHTKGFRPEWANDWED